MSGGPCASPSVSSIDESMDQLLIEAGMSGEEQRARVRSLISLAADMADDDGRVAMDTFVGTCTRGLKRQREGSVVDLTGSPATDSRWELAIGVMRANIRLPKYPVMMMDQTYLGLEAIMNAWIQHGGAESDRSDMPFRLVPGGPQLMISQEESKVRRDTRILREIDPSVDMGTFFRLHYRRGGDDTWQLYPLLVHLAFAKLVCVYLRMDADFGQRGVVMRNISVRGLSVQCEFSHMVVGEGMQSRRMRHVRLTMTRHVEGVDHMVACGFARLTFENHIVMRRLFADFIFPTVQIPDKQPDPEQQDCPICLEPVPLDVEFSGCGHRIHDGCLVAMDNRVCYLCRTPFFIP